MPQGLAGPAPQGLGAAARPWVWLGAAVLLALWLLALGWAPLFDVDEGAFAEASREMLVSGDWGHTTLNGADRFDKPILVYWLQALSMALLGPTEFAVRLPSALCAWALCLVVAHFAAPRLGAHRAAAAAVMLATSLGPLLIGRAATADALLNLLLALSAFDLWRFVESEGRLRTALRRAALWIGLGLLAKGPVALLVPVSGLLLWLLTVPGAQRWPVLRAAFTDPLAVPLLLLVAVPWYAYALHRHGQAFIDGFILRHNVQRFSGTLEGHSGSLLYYIWVLPLMMLPWTALLVPVLRRVRSSWRDPLARWLLLWVGFVLVFFSLSGTKLPHYVLYGYVPLMLLASAALQQASRGLLVAVTLTTLFVLTLALAGPQAAAAMAQPGMEASWQARAAAGAQAGWSAGALVAASVLVALTLGLSVWGWRQASSRAWALYGLGLCSALSITCWATPWWAQVLQGPVQRLALQAREIGLPLVQWRLHQPSAGFYARTPARRDDPAVGELALMRHDRWLALSAAERSTLRLLGSEPGFVLLQRIAPAPP